MNSSEERLRPIEPVDPIEAWCKTKADYSRTGITWSYFLDAVYLRAAAEYLKGQGYFLEDITGLDVNEGILIVYHFDHYDCAERLALRIIVPHDRKIAPSIASIISGADWHERECFDFFGVIFEGHPGLKPLLLPDDMEGHPLLKSPEDQRKSFYQILPLEMVMDYREHHSDVPKEEIL